MFTNVLAKLLDPHPNPKYNIPGHVISMGVRLAIIAGQYCGRYISCDKVFQPAGNGSCQHTVVPYVLFQKVTLMKTIENSVEIKCVKYILN